MIADFSPLDSPQDLTDYDQTYKKRKVVYDQWETPFVEFLTQRSHTPKLTRKNTLISLSTQDTSSTSHSLSLDDCGSSNQPSILKQTFSPDKTESFFSEDFWSQNQPSISNEKVGQLNLTLEQNFSPELTEPFFFEGSWSPDQFLIFSENVELSSSGEFSFDSQSTAAEESVNKKTESSNSKKRAKNATKDDKDEEKKRRPRKSNNSPPNKGNKGSKKGQNRMKNFQGLIAQHVKTLSKSRSKFFCQVISKKKLFLEKPEKFLEFITRYDKSAKTWSALEKFFSTDLEFARGFLELIYSFLSDKYRAEFNDWLDKGRMNEKNKEVLRENKEAVLIKFKNLGKKLFPYVHQKYACNCDK